MAGEGMPRALPRKGALDPFTSRIRDRMARARRMDERFPRALDLMARMVGRAARCLRGQAATFRGTRSPEKMREVLRGERAPRLSDVCIWATSIRQEARAAAREVAEELAGELGLTLRTADASTSTSTFLELLGRFAKEEGDVVHQGVQRAADGQLDLRDVEDLLGEIRQAEEQLDALRTHLVRELQRLKLGPTPLLARIAARPVPQGDGGGE